MGKIIAVAAQKGGVGRTTTVLTLGAGLAKAGKKVLLLDADSQGSLTFCLGYGRSTLPITLGKAIECVINGIPVSTDTFLHHQEGMDLVPSNRELAAVEMQLPQIQGSLTLIKKFLEPIRDQYDYILIDCMSSLGSVTTALLPRSMSERSGMRIKVCIVFLTRQLCPASMCRMRVRMA